MAYLKPLPTPSPISEPFWRAAREHRLEIQRCRHCATHIFYPRRLCPHCLSPDLEWVTASGKGSVYSYTIARRPTGPGFEPDVPYVIAIVELAEGPHLTTNIVGCDPEAVYVGMPVEAVFDDVTEEVTLVKFRPVAA